MGQRASKFLGVGQLKELVRSMGIRVRSQRAESNNLGLGVLLSKLVQEWNRASITVTARRFVVEIVSRLHDGVLEPRLQYLHAEAVTAVSQSNSNLGVVWWVSLDQVNELLFRLFRVSVGADSERGSHSGRRSDHITGSLVVG